MGRVEKAICVYSAGHVTRFQPMRLQHFWWWDNNRLYTFAEKPHVDKFTPTTRLANLVTWLFLQSVKQLRFHSSQTLLCPILTGLVALCTRGWSSAVTVLALIGPSLPVYVLVSRPPQSTLLNCQALTLLLNRWLACLTGSSILVLKLTFSPDPFPRNPPLSL